MSVKKQTKKSDSPIYICFNNLNCDKCKNQKDCPRYKAKKGEK